MYIMTLLTCIVYSYMYTSCTCIRARLLPALSKQSCKAIVRERGYSDSTIDVTPWGLASLACVLREIGSSTQIDQRLSLRTRSTSTRKVTKSEKCTSDKKSHTGSVLFTRSHAVTSCDSAQTDIAISAVRGKIARVYSYSLL